MKCRTCDSEKGPFDEAREVRSVIPRESGPDVERVYPVCMDCPDMPRIEAFRLGVLGMEEVHRG